MKLMGRVIMFHRRIYYGVICNNIVFVVFIGNRKCINIIIVIMMSNFNTKNKPICYGNKDTGEQTAFGHSGLLTTLEKKLYSASKAVT